MKPLLILGGVGVLAYYLYEQYKGSTTLTATIPVTGGGTTTTTPVVTTPGTPAYNSLAAIAARIQAAAGSGATYSADQWNVYLGQQAGITPPSPDTVFGTAFDPSDRSVNGSVAIPFATYWGPMSAFLTSSLGMSGLRGWGMGGWAA